MPFAIEDKLVVALASSALFDLGESDRIWRSDGQVAYRKYQREHENDILQPGVAFPFIRRLLSLNDGDDSEPVEVILLSRNDPDTGMRVMTSVKSHGLNITRSAFLSGGDPYEYIPAFNASLFLSANEKDVKGAIMAGSPAGVVLDSTFTDDHEDAQLRVAFDFDGVLADDEAERVFAESDLATYHTSEEEKSDEVLNPGPLKDLLSKIAAIQQKELQKKESDPGYEPRISIAIITARNAPAHARMANTLRAWGIIPDATFMLGGMDKSHILTVYRPHIFFDDQKVHLDTASGIVPSVHIPFGVANE